jgi:hypothetical protein
MVFAVRTATEKIRDDPAPFLPVLFFSFFSRKGTSLTQLQCQEDLAKFGSFAIL